MSRKSKSLSPFVIDDYSSFAGHRNQLVLALDSAPIAHSLTADKEKGQQILEQEAKGCRVASKVVSISLLQSRRLIGLTVGGMEITTGQTRNRVLLQLLQPFVSNRDLLRQDLFVFRGLVFTPLFSDSLINAGAILAWVALTRAQQLLVQRQQSGAANRLACHRLCFTVSCLLFEERTGL